MFCNEGLDSGCCLISPRSTYISIPTPAFFLPFTKLVPGATVSGADARVSAVLSEAIGLLSLFAISETAVQDKVSINELVCSKIEKDEVVSFATRLTRYSVLNCGRNIGHEDVALLEEESRILNFINVSPKNLSCRHVHSSKGSCHPPEL